MTVMPESVLAVGAHPDDIELVAGGTLAKWAIAGTRIDYLLCTSGEAGIADEDVALSIARRESEQRAAARVIGVREVVFLREPDGVLENSLALRRRIVREIRRLRPQALLTGDPTCWFAGDAYINHPDHRAASAAAIDAAFPCAGIARVFPEHLSEGLLPHRVSALWVACLDPAAANTRVEIDETFDRKLEALARHESQADICSAEVVTALARAAGGGLCETFRLVSPRENPFKS